MSQLLTIPQICGRLGIGKTRAFELIKQGKIASVQIGRSRRVTVEALDSYVASLVVAAEKQAALISPHTAPEVVGELTYATLPQRAELSRDAKHLSPTERADVALLAGDRLDMRTGEGATLAKHLCAYGLVILARADRIGWAHDLAAALVPEHGSPLDELLTAGDLSSEWPTIEILCALTDSEAQRWFDACTAAVAGGGSDAA